jgi:hypothetical protein
VIAAVVEDEELVGRGDVTRRAFPKPDSVVVAYVEEHETMDVVLMRIDIVCADDLLLRVRAESAQE